MVTGRTQSDYKLASSSIPFHIYHGDWVLMMAIRAQVVQPQCKTQITSTTNKLQVSILKCMTCGISRGGRQGPYSQVPKLPCTCTTILGISFVAKPITLIQIKGTMSKAAATLR
ncbi:hypothetical protein G9A89_000443 [Geosiphon pyriformis]|nr:hypothetical protein G9A89_000443 [Geosiphon pyriformis]